MEYYIGNSNADGPSLYHYGVKGMKWGVRKKRPTSSKVSTGKKLFAKKTTPSQTTKKAFNGEKKDISKATDDELNAYLKRMQLEKQVLTLQKELTTMTSTNGADNQKKKSAGKRFVSAVWKDMAYPAIKQGVTEAGKELIKKSLTEAINKQIAKRAASS